jgi:hypothetical protein
VNSGGKGDLASPGLYFHIDPRCMGVASGLYMLEPATLRKIREYLAANLDEFQKQLDDKDFKKYFKTIVGEQNKVLPAELKEAGVKQPLLFNKQFYYWAEYEAEDALREDLADFLMEHMRACRSMNAFLTKARG